MVSNSKEEARVKAEVEKELQELIEKFNQETHGKTGYDKEEIFVGGSSKSNFVPYSFLEKNLDSLKSIKDLLSIGYLHSSYSFLENEGFEEWYEKQFSKELTPRVSKKISLLTCPDQTLILRTVENLDREYRVMKKNDILVNGKSLPVQLGEWYAKTIFGLFQKKSASQRGFDFHLDDKRVEIKVVWSDKPSVKGVKIKRSLVTLSQYVVIVYLSSNFMIRDLCLLDSNFLLRKFSAKGHTLFIKENELGNYFFSQSTKHFHTIVNKSALMKFASPNFAMKLDGRV